ncbi:hypothetical protein HDU76_013075, partial [Blyttiomyces sp. JEL0837]
ILQIGTLPRIDTVQWKPAEYVEFLSTGETKGTREKKRLMAEDEERLRSQIKMAPRQKGFEIALVPVEKRTATYYVKLAVKLGLIYLAYTVSRAWFIRYKYTPYTGLLQWGKWKEAGDVFFFGVMLYCCLELAYNVIFHGLAEVFQSPFLPLMHRPYISVSIRDFWSRKWNSMVKAVLQNLVFSPILSLLSVFIPRSHISKHNSSNQKVVANQRLTKKSLQTKKNDDVESDEAFIRKALERPPATHIMIAVLATFIASGLFHEYCLLFLQSVPTKYEHLAFFSLNGLLCVGQEGLQKLTGFGKKWGMGGFVWNFVGWVGFALSLMITGPLFVAPIAKEPIFFEDFILPMPQALLDFHLSIL